MLSDAATTWGYICASPDLSNFIPIFGNSDVFGNLVGGGALEEDVQDVLVLQALKDFGEVLAQHWRRRAWFGFYVGFFLDM